MNCLLRGSFRAVLQLQIIEWVEPPNFGACLRLKSAVSKTGWTNLGLNLTFVVRCNVENS